MSALSAALQRLLYRGLIRLLLPVGLLLARKQDPARWRERLGDYPQPLPAQPLWIHAASVGEAKAAALLIQALREQGETGPYLVTTTTRTGGDTIRAELGEGITHRYAPLDSPGVVRRALQRLQPRLLIVMEVEIWPTLWEACAARQIPIVLANARLSESSLRRYQNRLPQLWRDTLNSARLILAQSAAIAERYCALGVDEERISVSGNLKYSLKAEPAVLSQGQALRQLVGSDRPVWLAASTHPDEEEIALAVQRMLLDAHPDLLLVLVPRHPQRFAAVAEICAASGLATQRRSTDPVAPVAPTTQLYLGDSLGELLGWYAAVDLCWVAGSLTDVGGHNVLEPAIYGCPMVLGRDMRNFEEITAALLQRGGALQVEDATGLQASLRRLLADAGLRSDLGQRARTLVAAYAEAARQQARAVRRLL